MKYDMVLKDVSSFVSEKKEEDRQRSYPNCTQPHSQQTKKNSDPQMSRSSPIDRGEIPWETTTVEESPPWNIEKSSPWNKIECPPSYRGERQQATAREGKIQSQTVMAAPPFENASLQKRPKCSKVTEMTHFKTPG